MLDMGNRLPKTVQRQDVVLQILREEDGLIASDIARRMTPDLLECAVVNWRGELYVWTPERLAMCGNMLYPTLSTLEKDGLVYGMRAGSNSPVLWFLSAEAKLAAAQVDPKLVTQIETIRVEP